MAKKQALKPDVFMIFYVGDYLAATTHMSTLEHGAYLLILFHYWRSGNPPPDDDARLARIARLSVTEWDTVRDAVRNWFHPVNLNGEWVLYNSKLERTMWEAHEGLSKKREASKAGNAAKAAKRAAEVRVAATAAHRLDTETVTETVPNRIPDGSPSGINPASQTGPESEAESDIEERKEEDICTEARVGSMLELPGTEEPEFEIPAFLRRAPEPEKPAPPALPPAPPKAVVPVSPTWIEMPTNCFTTKKETVPVTEAKVVEWQATYEAVDVRIALKAARQWLVDNPTKRKTKTGMMKYLNAWLARAQDQASKKGNFNGRESFGESKNNRFLRGLGRNAERDRDDEG